MRALLIWNPVAGRRPEIRQAEIQRAAHRLELAGWRVDTAETEAEKGARPAAQAGIAAGYDVLIACGGDGTLGQVAGEIAGARAARERLPIFAALPGGTTNLFGMHRRLPGNPAAAAEWLLRAHERPLKLGRALFPDGRSEYFLTVASAGLDAEVVRLLSPQLKTRLGKFAFVLTAMKAVYTYRFPWLTVRGAGREWRARQVIFGVTGYYAGPFRLGPSKPPAGMGRVVSLHGGRWRLPVYSAFLLAGRLYAAPAAGFSFEPSVGIDGVAPLELDGDSAGSTPVVLEMVPGAIRAFLR